MTSTTTVAALFGGRLLIAQLDLTVPEHHSPLQQALRDHRITITWPRPVAPAQGDQPDCHPAD